MATGERPFIRGSNENDSACLVIDKASHYCIRDLEMGFAQHAIRVVADSRVDAAPAGYLIENCFLHDIVGPDLSGSDKQGRLYAQRTARHGLGHLCRRFRHLRSRFA